MPIDAETVSTLHYVKRKKGISENILSEDPYLGFYKLSQLRKGL